MAQLSESVAIVKISRLLKDGEVIAADADDEVFTQLEAVLNELVDDSTALVEVIKAD